MIIIKSSFTDRLDNHVQQLESKETARASVSISGIASGVRSLSYHL